MILVIVIRRGYRPTCHDTKQTKAHLHLLLGRVVTTAPRFLQPQSRMITRLVLPSSENWTWLNRSAVISTGSNLPRAIRIIIFLSIVSSRSRECQWGKMGSDYEEQSIAIKLVLAIALVG